MFLKQKRDNMVTAALLMLAGLFFVLSAITMAGGISSFTAIHKTSSKDADVRAALSFFANQVRRGDEIDGVQLTTLFDSPALAVYEYYGGYSYVTYIYFHQGQLKEMFIEHGLEFDPQAGTSLLPLRSVEFSMLEDGRISCTATGESGVTGALALMPRSQLHRQEVLY